MSVEIANNLSEFVTAIGTVNSGGGGIIKIPAGANWQISDFAEGSVDNAFPTITTAISIVTYGGSAPAVLSRTGSNQFRFFEVSSFGALTLTNITLKNGYHSDGSAIKCNGTLLTLMNCTVEGSVNGFAISTSNSLAVTIQLDNCTLRNNDGCIQVNVNSNLLYISECLFIHNNHSVIKARNFSRFNMLNSNIIANQSPTWDIIDIGVGELKIIDCKFISNESIQNNILYIATGYISDEIDVVVRGCDFVSNKVGSISSDAPLWLANTSFRKLIESCYFENNEAVVKIDWGGKIQDCYFKENKGGIEGIINHFGFSGFGPLVVRGSRFEGNSGKLIFTSQTNCDIRLNSWEIPPDSSRFIEEFGGQVIYDGSNSPPAPCPQSGGQACCV